jgi:hypothetical protein
MPQAGAKMLKFSAGRSLAGAKIEKILADQ